MYKIIIIIFLLCVTTVRLKQVDNIHKFRFVGTFNDMGLSSSGIEYPSSNSGITSKSARLTRAKRTPFMYLVPVNEEHENADNEMTERSRPSRKIKRCKTALCKAGNIPLSGKYGDGMVKATLGESSGEPYGRSTRWKQIRTAKNSVISKLFKKETDSNENDEDNIELAELLRENLANERPAPNRRYRDKSGKFVCYCQREDCPDCRLSDSKKELLVGAPRTKENTLARDKLKKDRYRKLLRPNDYAIPKIPLVRLPELYREIPYDLRRNHGNANKMDVLPIVRGIPSNVHPLTVPFRVAYDPADTYLGTSGPVSQQYQQKFNNIYQHVPLKQYTVASKSKSDIPRRLSISMPENNGVGSRNNDFTTITSRSKENANDQNVNLEESIEDDTFDSNMEECIKLFGRKVCVLAASTNCNNMNKVKNLENRNFVIGSNGNVGSARNYYETSSDEQSSTYHGVNEDYYDVTESDMVSSDLPYNIINGEDIDDHRMSTEQSLGNYYDDYYDTTLTDVSSEIPQYVTSSIENDQILNDDYYDSETPKYVTIDSTEAAILGIASNQEEETTTVLTDANSSNNTEYKVLNPKNESSTYGSQNENNNNDNDLSSSTITVGDEKPTDTILGTLLEKEFSQNKHDINCGTGLDDFASTATKIEHENSTDTILTSENESSTYNSENQNDFTSTTAENKDETSTDTILGDDRNNYTEETHPGLDYSDIRVVTNGYFTSTGYDGSDENYVTGLDPSTYNYHLPNDGSINFLENSPSYDTNLQATNIPGIIKDQSNSLGVLPTRSYSDLAKSRFITDSTMNNNFNIDKTTTEDAADLLEKEPTNCEGQEHKIDDQGKESAIKYDRLDPATIVTTKSESESQETTTDSFLGYAISSLNYTTNNTVTSDSSTSFETTTPIESTESREILTIDDYTVREAILTTTEKNSIEIQTPEDTIDNEETTTTVTKIYDTNLDPIVGFSDKSFSESTDSIMNEENFSKDFDTTSNPITVNDNELERSEQNDDVSNNVETESTTTHLPFCDNTQLINSIRKVINNFTTDSASLEEPYVSTDNANEELSPEILEIPNLRSFLSLPQIENVIVKNVKNHLLKFAGLPKNALTGVQPGNVIRNTLRNILGILPKTQSELPPMTVMEHQLRNGQWTTNLVTLVPNESTGETENQNSLQKIHEHIEDLIFNPAIGLQAAKQNAVQNIIVQAVKHQIENSNGMAVEEDTIRDIVGSVLGNAFEEEQSEDEGNSFENSSITEDTTKGMESENDYNEAMTTEGNVLEDFYEHFEQIMTDLPLITNSDIETTTDSMTKLSTEGFLGNVQISSTEVNEINNNLKDSPSLNKEKSRNCLNQVHSDQVMIDLPEKNNSIEVQPTTASFTEDFVGSVQFSSTEMNKKINNFNANQSVDQKQPVDYANRVNSEPIYVETMTVSSTESYPEFSTARINEETDSINSQNLSKEQPSDYSTNVNSEQAMTTVSVTTNAPNIESTTVSEFSSTEINDSNLGKEQSNDYSNNTENNNFSTTDSYTENLQENHHTESTNISERTNDITNINEETTLGVLFGDQQQPSETTKKNKGETNESEVLRLPQNSFVGASNTGIEESSSANQGRPLQGKEKCRLCKMESCTSTHEIVTKVHKRVKTTTKKYYGAKENVASEGNPIVSSKHQEEDRSTLVSLESGEDVNRSNNDDDDVSTTCENLSDENLQGSELDENLFYKEKISKKKTNDDDKDDLSDLQNSELYYIGDNVKLPLEIKKLKDGSYALSISKSICENVLKRKCPCCVPLDGNVRSVRRTPTINGNTDRVSGTRKSAKIKSRISRKRSRRSTKINKESNWDDSVLKNELKTLTMPVMTFAKKYNLRLNLDNVEIENTTPDQLKRVNKINRDNIDIGSKTRLIERSNEITRDKKEFEKENNIYRDDDDQIENVDTNNPVFQRMKFVNRMRQNPELYRRQRAIEGNPNNRIQIIKSLLNWLRTLILH